MKLITHVCVLVFIAQSEALFFSGGSGGNIKLSGNFHGLLKNHPLLGSLQGSSTGAETSTATETGAHDEQFSVHSDPAPEDNGITQFHESTSDDSGFALKSETNSGTSSGANSHGASVSGSVQGSYSTGHDKFIIDALARHEMILKLLQAGVNAGYDRHIQRLEKLSNHFTKNKDKKTEASFDFDFSANPDDPSESISTDTKKRY